MGISGGLDSSTLLYLAVKVWKLKPLVIHFDNNYNTVAKLSDADPSDRGIDPMGIYGTSPAFPDGGTQATNGMPSAAFIAAATLDRQNLTASVPGVNRVRGSVLGAYQTGKDQYPAPLPRNRNQ